MNMLQRHHFNFWRQMPKLDFQVDVCCWLKMPFNYSKDHARHWSCKWIRCNVALSIQCKWRLRIREILYWICQEVYGVALKNIGLIDTMWIIESLVSTSCCQGPQGCWGYRYLAFIKNERNGSSNHGSMRSSRCRYKWWLVVDLFCAV